MNQTTQMQPVNRLYKSRIFAMLYSDRKDLLDLYNAVSGKHYEDPGNCWKSFSVFETKQTERNRSSTV